MRFWSGMVGEGGLQVAVTSSSSSADLSRREASNPGSGMEAGSSASIFSRRRCSCVLVSFRALPRSEKVSLRQKSATIACSELIHAVASAM